MRKFNALLTVSALILSPSAPASANATSNEASCVGKSVSMFGSSMLQLIRQLFGVGAVGEVASTHCDPSWD